MHALISGTVAKIITVVTYRSLVATSECMMITWWDLQNVSNCCQFLKLRLQWTIVISWYPHSQTTLRFSTGVGMSVTVVVFTKQFLSTPFQNSVQSWNFIWGCQSMVSTVVMWVEAQRRECMHDTGVYPSSALLGPSDCLGQAGHLHLLAMVHYFSWLQPSSSFKFYIWCSRNCMAIEAMQWDFPVYSVMNSTSR